MYVLLYGLKNALTWGRASRAELWFFILLILIFSIISSVLLLDGFLAQITRRSLSVILLVISIWFFVASFTITVRRLHDTNRSAWWLLIIPGSFTLMYLSFKIEHYAAWMILISTLPLAFLTIIVLLFRSTPGDNRFGPNPYGINDDSNDPDDHYDLEKKGIKHDDKKRNPYYRKIEGLDF